MFIWSTYFSSIVVALFRDTPLGYLHCTQVGSQIAKDSQFLAIFDYFGYVVICIYQQMYPIGFFDSKKLVYDSPVDSLGNLMNQTLYH